LATLGLAGVLYLGYASFVVLRAVCVLCVVTYGAVIGIFLVSGAVTSMPMTTLPRRLAGDLRALGRSPAALLVAVVFVTGAGSAVALFPREGGLAGAELGPLPTAPAPAAPVPAEQPLAAGQSEFERWYVAQPRVNLPVAADGAKVLIVKFTDYQCPACAQSYLWYRPILARYATSHPGQVRLVTLDFPLNPACNAAVPRGMHLAACEAAVAVRLAREHGRGEALEEWLSANHASLTPESVKAAARTVGGVTDFEARYAGVLPAVKTDAALGGLNNVHSTPTFFINGTMVAGALPPQYFDEAIALELKRAGG
jgi:protein-disulfide isomerase